MNALVTYNDNDSKQYEVTIGQGGISFVAVKLIAKNDMYNKGLQKGYVDLVEMHDVAETLAETINLYHKAGKLDDTGWRNIIFVFKPFIHKNKEWPKIELLLEDAEW